MNLPFFYILQILNGLFAPRFGYKFPIGTCHEVIHIIRAERTLRVALVHLPLGLYRLCFHIGSLHIGVYLNIKSEMNSSPALLYPFGSFTVTFTGITILVTWLVNRQWDLGLSLFYVDLLLNRSVYLGWCWGYFCRWLFGNGVFQFNLCIFRPTNDIFIITWYVGLKVLLGQAY